MIAAYQKMRNIDRMYSEYVNRLTPDYDKLMDALMNAYKKKNIDIIEFTNYLDAYRASVIQLIEIQFERMRSIEELNLATGNNQF